MPSTKMTWIRVLFTMTIAILLMAMLYRASNLPNKLKNGFSRSYSLNLHLIGSWTIENNCNNIIAAGSSQIYISTFNAGEIYVTNYSGKILNHLFFQLNNLNRKKNDDLIVPVLDSPNIHFFNFNRPGILTIALDKVYGNYELLSSSDLTKAVLADSGTMVIRRLNNGQDQIFSKYFIREGRFEDEHHFSGTFHDGGMSTDGTLNFDRDGKLCTYVYYYKNGFIVFDTGLNFIKTVKTIDTFSNYQISVGRVEAGNSQSYTLTNVTPSNMLNISSSISKGYLFILSSVKADNDSPETFEMNNIMDIYNIKNGKYSGSMHIPKGAHTYPTDFKIWKDTLILLANKNIKCYKIVGFHE